MRASLSLAAARHGRRAAGRAVPSPRDAPPPAPLFRTSSRARASRWCSSRKRSPTPSSPGLPAHHGLYAAALAPIAAALFASSPALQTGPTAMSAVLVFAALAPLVPAGTAAYASAAALLALLVGAVRIGLGLLRAGALAYALSGPVLRGFTWGAGLLIAASQLPRPSAPVRRHRLLLRALRALLDPAGGTSARWRRPSWRSPRSSSDAATHRGSRWSSR
jgi:hypothetical protein